MHPTIIGVFVFAVTFAGTLLGLRLRRTLPPDYLRADSQDAIKLSMGLIATMTALVLGLVTASTKSSFDAMDSAVTQVAMQSLTLDPVLARYGDETSAIRKKLQAGVQARVETIWPSRLGAGNVDPSSSPALLEAEQVGEAIRSLSPATDKQRALQTKAVDLAESLLQSRWIGLASAKPSVPLPFLAVLIFWLAFIFVTFGLMAPRNLLVLGVQFACALSVGSALFLILEMDSPFHGLIRVSAEPLQRAIARMNR